MRDHGDEQEVPSTTHRSETHQAPPYPGQPCMAWLPIPMRTSPRSQGLLQAITSSVHLPGICTGRGRTAGAACIGWHLSGCWSCCKLLRAAGTY